MTDADQIAREIVLKLAREDESTARAADWAVSIVVAALREARTAGFNEAKGRAVGECRAYEKRMGTTADTRAAAGKPCTAQYCPSRTQRVFSGG